MKRASSETGTCTETCKVVLYREGYMLVVVQWYHVLLICVLMSQNS